MKRVLIKNAILVNEGSVKEGDIRLSGDRIDKIAAEISAETNDQVIDAQGAWLLPGMIDDQVHFREPGLEHKGRIATESLAAVAGGITSFMEMPNVKPSTTTAEALEHKFGIAEACSAANYSFYLGATEDNLDEIKALNPSRVCGVKVFMGASTGDLLVENPQALENIFRESPVLIVTHCEHGSVLNRNLQVYRDAGKTPSIIDHPKIRNVEACYASSSLAVGLARKHGSQLHVLHITTEKELSLFEAGPVANKQITAEACVHHLWFSEEDYPRLGNLIKCNPSIKAPSDRAALINALHTQQIDIVATDHAPHTWDEKQQDYENAPAGLPLVQHALLSMLDHVHHQRLSIEQVVEKTAHNPAIRYGVRERGFLREGYFADVVLVDPAQSTPVSHENTYYHCKWTPFDGHSFSSQIKSTWVNGVQVFDGSSLITGVHPGAALIFDR
ncbi:dihydroorotase [Marinibactrum halimedae]|uniref:Dihydroorotase n=1 Tax=Marinibactrum halimedae TaxID=1444977 RepID=A0AA37WL75_9GAMM|nr:dihydroorotase [Marinibactrum halimedae]MCD9459642.1 dihydroorotase [Marinibactrum halimedae]GLS25669.1 dihydroorotase [Marinibactrum halimedae]